MGDRCGAQSGRVREVFLEAAFVRQAVVLLVQHGNQQPDDVTTWTTTASRSADLALPDACQT